MAFTQLSDTSLQLQEQVVDSTSADSALRVNASMKEPASNLSADPPTHKASLPLDRVGGGNDAIGPRKRSRRGPTPRTPQQQARSVARRNARERKRVRLVNLGFATLRDHIPPHLGTPVPTGKSKTNSNNRGTADSNSKKLSKVETLRCAIEYIKQLREAIGYDDKDSTGTASNEGFSSSSSPPDLSSSPSYCMTSSPVIMLMSESRSPPMFHEENDDFLGIMDWTTL